MRGVLSRTFVKLRNRVKLRRGLETRLQIEIANVYRLSDKISLFFFRHHSTSKHFKKASIVTGKI